MFIKSKMIRDTVLLTIMQLFLDTAALLLNSFITHRLGTSAMGILTLTGSFLGLASVISNGNAFLCTSRLISEELGKKESNPDRVLFHGIRFCIMLSIAVSAGIFVFSDTFSGRFFSGTDMTGVLKIIPAALVTGAVSSCFKGYFNACRKSSAAAVGDVLEFAVKSAIIVLMALAGGSSDEGRVCVIMTSAIVGGNIFSLVYMLVLYAKLHVKHTGRGTLTFRQYAAFAFPIMGGGVLTAVLSSTNDALIPICLRQYGDSAGEALSLFGIFEAIVIPTLFFPSVVLCSMSGLIVSEAARASAADNRERIGSLGTRLTKWTLIFAVFVSAFLMRFGVPIGEMLGGGELGGRMIAVIAPVVPFIYMEIILEAMIKGMGMQAFSSLNYLAEYAVRISAVLILVPHIGFYGIAVSYYASNIIGNCSRFIRLVRSGGISFRPFRTLILPIVYAFMTMETTELFMRIFRLDTREITGIAVFALLWGGVYFVLFVLLGKVRIFHGKRNFSLCKVTNNYYKV